MRGQSEDIPPIHDVSTRPADPPVFSSAILAQRAALTPDVNPVVSLTVPVSTAGKIPGPADFADMADQIPGSGRRRSLSGGHAPDHAASPADAYAAALAEARAQGWTIVSQDATAGTLNATATTFWFGFKDDVAVRVRAEGAGSVIDVRSTSRVGLSDLGANAARIEAYLAGVSGRL